MTYVKWIFWSVIALLMAAFLHYTLPQTDIVRISVPDKDSSAALKQIIPEVSVPIVADIHFHYMRGVEAAEVID